MKFKRIRIKNFMRYKDVNELVFSCDPQTNVTVVLGDNTFGKTTIAQAFRWGLYGEVINTKYDKTDTMTLLNNEILEAMDANSREHVEVMIEVEDGKYVYEFVRSAEFVRKFPKMIAKQTTEKLFMRVWTGGEWSDYISDEGDNRGRNRGKVTEQISNLFPKELSNYFLFDGERWSDEKTSSKDIKETINTIMGISPLSSLKYHLIEHGSGGRGSVIRLLKGKSAGSDDESSKIQKEQEFCSTQIEECTKKIEAAQNAIDMYAEAVKKSEEILNGNQKIEEEQREAKLLEKRIETSKDHINKQIGDFIRQYSKEAFEILIEPLIFRAKEVLSEVELDGKGIPNVNDKTIYYLLENEKCLCGSPLCKGTELYDNIMSLLDVVPPKLIGTEVAYFQERLQGWGDESKQIYESLEAAANSIELEKAELEDMEESLYHVNKRIDGKINFGQERIRMQSNMKKLKENQEIVRKCENNIIDYKRRINNLDEQLVEIAKKNEKTLRYRRDLAYAEELLKLTERLLKKKEEPLFDELNQKIKKNFSDMFSEKEKYAQLGKDYRLHLYYKKISEEGAEYAYEETALSEGERIASNFVFIVSILELAKEKKQEDDDGAVLSLPLVLDAPFSKLSGDNTGLVASVLPSVADQVIIFMLDKDWKASKLDDYTQNTFKYRVKKEADGNSSSFVRET